MMARKKFILAKLTEEQGAVGVLLKVNSQIVVISSSLYTVNRDLGLFDLFDVFAGFYLVKRTRCFDIIISTTVPAVSSCISGCQRGCYLLPENALRT